jgi:hypothetical protein
MAMLRKTNGNRCFAGRWFAAVIGLALATASGSWSQSAFGQSGETLRPLLTFGSNGWLAPGSSAFLGTSSNERGLGFNPVTKNIVLASRNSGNRIVVINGTTGVITGSSNNAGITGGTLLMMGVGISGDGQIYVPNLANSGGGTLKVYRWNSENDLGTNPSVPFSLALPASTTGTTTTGTWSFGNTFDVIGSGTNAKFVTAGSSAGTSNSASNNSNFMIGNLDGTNFNTIYRTIPNTTTANNDYRLSAVFVDADTIIGKGDNPARITNFVTSGSGQTSSNATVSASLTSGTAPLGSTSTYRILDYTSILGRDYLAIMNTANSVVNVYDITTAMTTGTGDTPVLVASLTTQVGSANANLNAAGQLAWGTVTQPNPASPWYYEAPLYALNTNNGIQAMIFSVPEPSTWAMVATAGIFSGGLMVRRRITRGARRVRRAA